MNRFVIRALCRPEASTGFEMAGIPVMTADDVAGARRMLREMRARQDIGVLLVQQELLEPEPGSERDEGGIPLVVPFPGPAAEGTPSTAEAYVAEILRRAIGYRVRLR